MARFTVADCMDEIPNRFEMTLIAALRARQMAHGSAPLINDIANDKFTVLALREVAEHKINTAILLTIE